MRGARILPPGLTAAWDSFLHVVFAFPKLPTISFMVLCEHLPIYRDAYDLCQEAGVARAPFVIAPRPGKAGGRMAGVDALWFPALSGTA